MSPPSALSLAAIIVPLLVLLLALLAAFLWYRKMRRMLTELKDAECRAGGEAIAGSFASSEWTGPPPSPRVQIDATGSWESVALRDVMMQERVGGDGAASEAWGLRAPSAEDPGELSASSAGTGQGTSTNRSRVSLPPPHNYEQPALFGSSTTLGTKSSNTHSDSSAAENDKVAVGCRGQRVLSKRYSRRPASFGGKSSTSPSQPPLPKPLKTRKVKRQFGIGLADDVSYREAGNESDSSEGAPRPTSNSDPGHHRHSTNTSFMFLSVDPSTQHSSASVSPSSTPSHSSLGRRNSESAPRRSSKSGRHHPSRLQLSAARDWAYPTNSSPHLSESPSPRSLPSGAASSHADSRHTSEGRFDDVHRHSSSMERLSTYALIQPPSPTTTRTPPFTAITMPTFRPSPLAATPIVLSPVSSNSGGATPLSPQDLRRISFPRPQSHRAHSGFYTSADLYSDSEVILAPPTFAPPTRPVSAPALEESASLLLRTPSIEPALLLGEEIERSAWRVKKKERRLALEEREEMEAQARFPHPYARGMSWLGGVAADSRGSLPRGLEEERARLMLTNPDSASSFVNSTTASGSPSRAGSLDEQGRPLRASGRS